MKRGNRDAIEWLDTKKPAPKDRGVPLSYIRKVWKSNYLPPITTDLVEKLIMTVKNEIEEKKNEDRQAGI